MKTRSAIHPGLIAAIVVLGGLGSPLTATAAPDLPIAQEPLFRQQSVPPLNMLVVGKDHKIYYEAYNDASDLNGDGILDIGYKPALIDYYGYFNSKVCYSHDGSKFNPQTVAAGSDGKQCSSSWSGDFLNYLTTSRMDALRKVLYGGMRSTDTATETVLKRAYVPQDAHSFGKEYTSTAVDGYNIASYAPLMQPTTGRRHLFANTALSDNGTPLLRVLNNSDSRVWEWLSIERPVAGNDCTPNGSTTKSSCTANGATRTDYAVLVTACPTTANLREAGVCKEYKPSGGGASSFKPTGLLHEYAESDRMFFGLITGSQFNNTEGGVLRRNIDDFKKEVNQDTGVFLTNVDGIVSTLDALRMIGFGYPGTASYLWSYGAQGCPALGWRALANGECRMWGNPIGEMMFESLRYFAGAATPNARFSTGGSAVGATEETTMGLTTETWKDPYAAAPAGGGFPACAKPFQTVISDINPSYDSGLPGSAFAGDNTSGGSMPTTISSFSAGGVADSIWGKEFGSGRSVFIGESGGVADGAPTAKAASSFSDIRGLAPEEPSKQGSYYSAAVANYGFKTDVNEVEGQQNVRTFSVALASPLPRIQFPIGAGVVSLVPFAKSIAHPGGGCSVRGDDFRVLQGLDDFRPTNTIVDFYVESIVNLPGAPTDSAINEGRGSAVFRINYEDVEQGNDHDMDVIVRYALAETATGDLSVTLHSEYQAGSVMHHVGYIISGTQARDGTYLVVRDSDGNSACVGAGVQRYKLDTPQYPDGTIKWAGDCANPADCPRLADNTLMPLQDTRVFRPGNSGGALLLRDPLWYAAKYGGFDDANGSGLPDGAAGTAGNEWDKDLDGVPDNYFLVTNPATLRPQLEKAFDQISEIARPTGALTVTGARVGAGSLTYDATFQVDASGADWTGNLRAFDITPTGALGSQRWEAVNQLPAESSRNIFVGQSTGNAMSSQMAEFEATALGSTPIDQLARIGLTPSQSIALFGPLTTVDDIVSYLRGDQSKEQSAGPFRKRSVVLGDIINSRPVVAAPKDDYGYGLPIDASPTATAFAASYRAYLAAKSTRSSAVFIGANDGMLHAFDGRAEGGGAELFAFIPSSVVGKLGELPKPSYSHEYYVDGDLNIGDARLGSWKTVLVGSPGAGGKGVFALDVSSPAAFDADDLMWELTSADNDNIGQSIGRVEIIRGEDNNWYAAFGNGFNSVNGNPALMLVDLGTGLVVGEIQADDGGDFSNGLGQIVGLDLDFNGKVDTIYGGDYRGNVWKFDLSGSSSASWGVAFGAGGATPLFTATDRDGNPQPVTGGFEIATGPENGVLLYFGSGSYFLTGDSSVDADPPVMTLYGVLDRNAPITGSRAALQEQQITAETAGAAESGVAVARNLTRNGVDYTTQDGFFLDLVVQSGGGGTGLGERFVGIPRVQSGKVFFTTFQPLGTECNPGGLNFLYGLDAVTGAAGLGSIRAGSSGNAVCGTNCGGIALGGGSEGGPGGPVRESVMIVPPRQCVRGVDPGCDPPPRPCVPGPGCAPAPPLPTDNELYTPCSVVIRAANSPEFTLPRPCGRQSWRQVR